MPLHSPFVVPLDESFRAVLDSLARARGWPSTSDPARLGPLVAKLSAAYNGAQAPRGPDALAARLGFSFARDVPKGAGAVRELVASGRLSLAPGRALRVLDVGAGLGATSRGVVRALAAAGASGGVTVDAVDSDDGALALAAAIARARPAEGAVTLELRTQHASAGGAAGDRYDLVVLGQVLSELDGDAPDRVARHAALLRSYAARLSAGGFLAVVEPALRTRTRHLQAVRDALLASPVATGSPALHVVAPCVHDAPCPMLAEPSAWCHEDLDLDLPAWLVPVARAAGLRYEGLTFSYLVLGREPVRAPSVRARALRVVSAPIVTKGKRELFLCGGVSDDGGGLASYVRAMRLDRHATAANAAWERAERGDLVELAPPLVAARPRIEPGTEVKLPSRVDSPSRDG